jgi:hypothetical protein
LILLILEVARITAIVTLTVGSLTVAELAFPVYDVILCVAYVTEPMSSHIQITPCLMAILLEVPGR